MKLSEVLSKDLIVLELQSRKKRDIIQEMVALLERSGKVKDAPQLIRAIQERERIGSTGIGEEVAIPHGKTDAVEGIVCGMGISRDGVNYHSLDGKQVKIVVMLASEEAFHAKYLSLLAGVSRILKKAEFRQQLLDATSPQQIIELIVSEEETG